MNEGRGTAKGRVAPLFGLPAYLEAVDCGELWAFLSSLWLNQLESAPIALRKLKAAITRLNSGTPLDLDEDLRLMSVWFDPIASGKRLREVISALGTVDAGSPPPATEELYCSVGPGKALVTLEGRAVLWLLVRHGFGSSQFLSSVGDPVLISVDELDAVSDRVRAQYRGWAMQRISSVSDLLVKETATLRPTAAGLLLVLLLNRNTSWDRRLPSPDDRATSAAVSRAITSPALAFARTLTGKEGAKAHGLDLYRGWALGELSRRLGPALHREDRGVWIDEDAVAAARARLAESLAARSKDARQMVPAALDAALAEYEARRPELSGLGVAFERPDATAELMFFLRTAATVGFPVEAGGGK